MRPDGAFESITRNVSYRFMLPIKTVRQLVRCALEELKEEAWRTGRLTIGDFGTFSTRERKAMKLKEPNGDKVHSIPAARVMRFRPAPSWRTR